MEKYIAWSENENNLKMYLTNERFPFTLSYNNNYAKEFSFRQIAKLLETSPLELYVTELRKYK